MQMINNINKRLSASKKKLRLCERATAKQQASQTLKKTQKRLQAQKRTSALRNDVHKANRGMGEEEVNELGLPQLTEWLVSEDEDSEESEESDDYRDMSCLAEQEL